MRSLAKRAVLGLAYLCGFFALLTIIVGVVGLIGVRSTADVSNSIVHDELATSAATASAGRSLDAAHFQGDELFLTTDPASAAARERTLYDVTVPQVDSDLALLGRLHSGDDANELAEFKDFTTEWKTVRAMLRPQRSSLPGPIRVARLDAAYAPMSRQLDNLISRETSDAQIGESRAAATATATAWFVLGAVLFALIAAVLTGRAVAKRIRRAVEPENEQMEFVETLQVTDSEQEAHDLLKRHIERAVPGTNATVLNRNNSADRLEAVTTVAADSCLSRTLQHAAPRACIAVRSARPHRTNGSETALLGCAVCGDCPGSTSCTPLTISGEVIGAVLVTGEPRRSDADEQRIRDSVIQAAPVLANLRNLAIAEVRAATDSLTGLANKRAVTDTLKRMLAQASRTLTPLSLVMVDLDHFKRINDELGHPIGDQALANVGAAITSALRASDFAGRNGGEEFAVLLPETGLDGASATAEKIRVAVAGIDLPPGTDLTLTASLGIAVYPDHATTTERLERLADAALYTAKRLGRNRVEIAEPSQDVVTPNAATGHLS